MKSMLFAAAIFLLPIAEKKIEGRWESRPSVNGNVTGVFFKPDNSFEAYVNKKPFATGKYTVQDDVLSFTDNGCDGKPGVYRLAFYSNNDSLTFQCIDDSCTDRRQGMTRLVLGRVKK